MALIQPFTLTMTLFYDHRSTTTNITGTRGCKTYSTNRRHFLHQFDYLTNRNCCVVLEIGKIQLTMIVHINQYRIFLLFCVIVTNYLSFCTIANLQLLNLKYLGFFQNWINEMNQSVSYSKICFQIAGERNSTSKKIMFIGYVHNNNCSSCLVTY